MAEASDTADFSLRDIDRGPLPTGALLLVRVWLTDRPGALGQVASRIGAMRGDIIGVDVLERTETIAIDEFAVALPELEHVELLVREIEEVDGVSVEEWRVVDRFPDPRLDALISAARLCHAASSDEVFGALVEDACTEFHLDWAAVLSGEEVAASSGETAPDATMLQALASGTAASPLVAAGHAGPDDLAVASMPLVGAVLLAGRDGHPFRRRERKQLLALARIAERVAELLG
jgi:hypothetical protein